MRSGPSGSAWTTRTRCLSIPQYNGIWRSSDKGMSWEFRSNENGRPMYFSQIRVDPADPDLVYIVDLRIYKSRDGARTFETLDGYGHVDQHAFWINPADSDHLIAGNDGSVDVSYDQGETWESLRRWSMGQPYHASVDMRRPYYVCTGLQDNGSWCGPSAVRTGEILSEDWYRVGGGDGFYTAVDPTDHTVVYSESQNGNIRRLSLATGEQVSIRPRAPSENNPSSNIVPMPAHGTEIRWNWNTPFILSPHNPDVVHAGGNRFFTSMDRGETWTMSPDLSRNMDRDMIEVMGQANALPRCNQMDRGQECILSRNDGVSAWGAAVSLTESPLVPGLLWMGTDDGNLQDEPGRRRQLDRSGREHPRRDQGLLHLADRGLALRRGHGLRLRGRTQERRSRALRVCDARLWGELGEHHVEPAGVWQREHRAAGSRAIGTSCMPGTEFEFFVSLDEGGSWHRFMTGLPVVRIDDVLVHPRDNDLVVATHGRSVLVMDDIHAAPAADARGDGAGRVSVRAPEGRGVEAEPDALALGDGRQGAAGGTMPCRARRFTTTWRLMWMRMM